MDHRALLSLLGFAAWQVALVLAVACARVLAVSKGQKKPNEFPSGQPHGGDAYWRLNRAHMNAAENLAVFAVVVLVGHLLGVRGGTFAVLAQVWLGARIAQSLIHISSGSSLAVNLRFSAFGVQIACFLVMAWKVLQAA